MSSRRLAVTRSQRSTPSPHGERKSNRIQGKPPSYASPTNSSNTRNNSLGESSSRPRKTVHSKKAQATASTSKSNPSRKGKGKATAQETTANISNFSLGFNRATPHGRRQSPAITEPDLEQDQPNENLNSTPSVPNQQSTTMAATKPRMPWPSSPHAPSFKATGDLDEAAQLFRFLSNVELCLTDAGIDDEQKKKDWVVRYASPDEEQIWRSLDTFKAGVSYEDWKADMLKAYPSAEEFESGSLYILEKICTLYKNSSDANQGMLIGFVRKYKNESDKLLKPPALCTNRELTTKFLGTLDPDFATRVMMKLDVEATMKLRLPAPAEGAPAVEAKRKEDRYALQDVFKVVQEMVSGQFLLERSAPYGAFSTLTPTVKTTATTKSSDPSVKQELDNMQQQVAELIDSFKLSEKRTNSGIESILKTLSQGSSSSPTMRQQNQDNNQYAPRENNNECFYCGKPGHYIDKCTVRAEDLAAGTIIIQDNEVRFPDGSKLPYAKGVSMKSRIEQWTSARKNRQLYAADFEQNPGLANVAPQRYYSLYTDRLRDCRDDIIDNMNEANGKPTPVATQLVQQAATRVETPAPAPPPSKLEQQLEVLIAQMSLLTASASRAPAAEEGPSRQGF